MVVETSKIDALFAEWDTTETPGCVLAVIKGGAIAYQRAYGMADLERDVALTTDSISARSANSLWQQSSRCWPRKAA
jgi:CubicO group peptidase (beta-lactamase class C family)